MKDWVNLIHSYQFSYNDMKFNSDNTMLLNESGKCILGLENIPSNNDIYKSNIEYFKIKKKSLKHGKNLHNIRNDTNMKIIVQLNVKQLSSYLKNGKTIPYRQTLFKLLRRNYNLNSVSNYIPFIKICNYKSIQQLPNKLNNLNLKLLSFQLDTVLWILNREKNMKPVSILKRNIINIKNLYIDLDLERLYTNNTNLHIDININGGILFDMSLCFSHVSLIYHMANERDNLYKKNTIFLNNSNLILCSSSNIDKWRTIIEKFTKLKLIIIQNKNNMEKYTYNDLVNANIVIISFNCFTHNYFTSLWQEYMYNNQSYRQVYETLVYEKKNNNILSEKNSIYQLIDWKRLIIDNSINSLEKNQLLREMVLLFNCKYKWMIESYNNIYNLNDIYDVFINKNIDYSPEILDKLSCFTRQTNIKNGILKYAIKRKVCIDLNIIERKYYEQLESNNIEISKKLFCSLSDNSINLNNVEYDNLETVFQIDDKLIQFKEKTNKDGFNEKCSICLNKIDVNQIGFTKCKHLYCYNCIYLCVQNNMKCPQCRIPLSYNDIFRLTYTSNKFSINIGSKLKYITDYVSTKKTNIIILSTFLESIVILETQFKKNNINFISSNKTNKFINLFNLDHNILLLHDQHIKNIDHIKSISEVIVLESLYDKYDNIIDFLMSKLYNYNNYYTLNILELVSKNTIETNC